MDEYTQLNGTEIVSLDNIASDGLGQLNLNYVDPVDGHKLITGAIFHINHDLTQPKAMTWNQNALLSSSTKSPAASSTPTISSSTPAALSTSRRSVPTAANTVGLLHTVTAITSAGKSARLASTPATLSTSKTSIPTAAKSVELPPTVTATPSTGKNASSPTGTMIASIVLGTVLGVILAAALIMLWARRRRRTKTSEQAIRLPSTTPLPVDTTTSELQEKDAGPASGELTAGARRWELDAGKP
ncbi:hypothetical protein G7Y79_00004g014880 [Physcia stellaris]|nr:hypothetical protein G7Y79_00004g014880 [Physcia stellaris]